MTPQAPIGATDRVRRRGAGRDAAIISAAVTVSFHALVLAWIAALEVTSWMGGGDDPGDPVATAAPIEVAPLAPSCDADAVLRAAAGAAWCETPFVDDPADCLALVDARLRTDFIRCHLDTLDLPEVVVVPVPEKIFEIPPTIDAEPLLEPLTPEEELRFEQEKVAMLEPPPPPPQQPPPPPPQQRPLDTQVIEAPRTNDEAPDQARFLSEHDNKVDQQKVARGSKHEEMIAKPEAEELAAKPEPKKATQPEPPEDEEIGKDPEAPPTPGALSMRKPGHPDPAEVAQEKKARGAVGGSEAPAGDGPSRKKGDGAVSQEERKPVEGRQGDAGAGGGKPRAPNLRPDDETLERIAGGGSVDHVEDVDEGEENAFNTKRWVHASFFNRMKRQVAQNWDPQSVWRREDPEGKHFGYKARVTQLRISLDPRGRVQKIVVVSPSGAEALDDEAIRAFKAAQPFPNPPQALVKDGRITFEFGFHFTIGERKTTWRVTRSL